MPDLLAPAAEIFGDRDPALALWHFAKSLDAPLALKDLGLKESNLDRATELATKNPYWNPRDIAFDGIRGLLQRAWSGEAPQP